jgi:hypothetical protein
MILLNYRIFDKQTIKKVKQKIYQGSNYKI